jgi:hypothetical protein
VERRALADRAIEAVCGASGVAVEAGAAVEDDGVDI